MSISLLLENTNISITNVEFFYKAEVAETLLSTSSRNSILLSHYHKSVFIGYILQMPTYIPTFPSFIWIVDTHGLRQLWLTWFKHEQRKPGVPTKWESEDNGILPKFHYQFDDTVHGIQTFPGLESTNCHSKPMRLWECLSRPVQTSLRSFAASSLDRCQFHSGIHVVMVSTWLMQPPLHYSAEYFLLVF